MAVVVNGIKKMLASKFRGCLIGGLIGDCLGAPFEGDFPVSKSVLANYLSVILKETRNESVQIQPYTDDTAMTLSVAKSFLKQQKFDPVDMAKRFTEEFYSQPRRGYGANVVDIFEALKTTDYADVFEPAKHQFHGTGSYGNGAAMRVAPISLFGYNNEELITKIAEDSAKITHTHQNGYNGAILQSLAVHQALNSDIENGFDPIDFVNTLLKKMEKIEKEIKNSGSLDDKNPYRNSLVKIKEIFVKKQLDITAEEISLLLGNNISAHRSVPTAIFSFLRSFHPIQDFKCDNPFVRTIYFSIAVGGDTDTIASMAGSIAGAYHGDNTIPENLKKKCEAFEEVEEIADKIVQLHTKTV